MSRSDIDIGVIESDRRFFDSEAEQESRAELLIPQDQIDRYRFARAGIASNIAKEELFAHLLPLKGKRVLDYGCGTGENACLFASCGADVTAFDLSPESIAVARRRAALHGLADRIQFDCLAAGATGYPACSFDIVAGFAILHHLHHALSAIYGEVDRILRPDGIACFIEPVANSAVLRGLRGIVPVPRHATPDERQLRYAELDALIAYGFRRIEYIHFHCFARLARIFGESAETPLRRLDHHLLRLIPALKRFYGIIVVIARR